jgi:glutathione S-transferase
MGASQAGNFEVPSSQHTATLYYFGGRGLADQIRWMMAATNVDFTQKVVNKREKFLDMAGRQLPFGQLPLLQIDGMEIVQSQAAVRYLARRGGLQGSSPEGALKCDMIAEAVRDLLPLLLAAPFRKYSAPAGSASAPARNEEEWVGHAKLAREKWGFIGSRLEAILQSNLPSNHPALALKFPPKKAPAKPAKPVSPEREMLFLVGSSLTYADVLVAHVITWMVEEFGPEVVRSMPLLVNLQNQVIHTYILHTYTYTCIHTYIHTNIHSYIHPYTYTHTHTYIHTYIGDLSALSEELHQGQELLLCGGRQVRAAGQPHFG